MRGRSFTYTIALPSRITGNNTLWRVESAITASSGSTKGGARLLDDDRGGAHAGSRRRSARRLGRLRETAADFGDQRIYASHKSIMFSRKSCYFFVRPRRSFLEVCVFLGRTLKSPQVRRVNRGVEIQDGQCHSDPAPRRGRAANDRVASEAYDYSGAVAAIGATARVTKKTKTARKRAKSKARASKRH